MTDAPAARVEYLYHDERGDQDESDEGTPQPASAPMSKEEADRLVARTRGQLQAFRAADGHWYLYETKILGLTR
jgi:hypothetical protein